MIRATSRRQALLVGTAVSALLAQPVLADDKWQPYAEIYGRAGTERVIGGGEVFYPLYQDDDNLLFLDLRGRADSDDTAEGNLGLAYRSKIEDSWVLGGYGYVDVKRSELDNTYWNLTVGLEALSEDWDLRVNGYLPLSDSKAVADGAQLVLTDTFIGLQSGEETPMHGLDAEVGWRLPLLPADGDQEVRVFAGGYWFAAEDVDTVAGPRARLEYRIYDPFGNGSRLTFDTALQWDEVRGTDLSAGVTLRVPFSFFEAQQQTRLTGLDRRMVDKIQRDVDIVTSLGEGDIEAVTVENLLTPTHQIRFVQSGDSVQGAADEMGAAGIIVVQGDAGALNGPVELHAGQAMIGGGHTVKLTGAETGTVVSYTPAGQRPELNGNGGVAVRLANDNFVGGLDIVGPYGTGIFGDVERAHIRDNYLSPDEGNPIDGIQLRSQSPTQGLWIVDNNVIQGFSGEGIDLETGFHEGGEAQTVLVRGNAVLDVDSRGISINATASFGTTLQDVTVEGNAVTRPGNNREGIFISADVEQGATFTQTVTVRQNDMTQLGGAGIAVGAWAAGSFTLLRQQLEIADNFIQGADGSDATGIFLSTAAANEGMVEQDVSVLANWASDVHAGFRSSNTAESDGELLQSFLIQDNDVSSAEFGLQIVVLAIQGEVSQTLDIADNDMSDIEQDGFEFHIGLDVDGEGGNTPTFIEDAVVDQTLTLSGNTVENADGDGFEFEAYLGADSSLTRDVVASGNTADAGDAFGFSSKVQALGEEEVDEEDVSLLFDSFRLTDNSFTSISEDAIQMDYELTFGVAGDIDLTFLDNALRAGGAGIEVSQEVNSDAESDMAVEIRGNQVLNSGAGFSLLNYAGYANAEQTAILTDNTVTNSILGLRLNNVSSFGVATQEVTLSDNSFTEVFIGADIDNELIGSGLATQVTDFSPGGNSIGAINDGIQITNFVGTQTLEISGGIDFTAGEDIDPINAGGGTQVINP